MLSKEKDFNRRIKMILESERQLMSLVEFVKLHARERIQAEDVCKNILNIFLILYSITVVIFTLMNFQMSPMKLTGRSTRCKRRGEKKAKRLFAKRAIISDDSDYSSEDEAQEKVPKKIVERTERFIKYDDETNRYALKYCPKPDFVFLSTKNVFDHQRKVNHVKFKCTEEGCNKKFETMKERSEHLALDHGYLSCPVEGCDYVADSESKMKNHQRKHRPKTYICSICGKKFNRPDALTQHLVSHSDEKSFICTHCKRSFARKHDCQDHEKQHEKQKGDNDVYCNRCKFWVSLNGRFKHDYEACYFKDEEVASKF